jgi:hypothetical protein
MFVRLVRFGFNWLAFAAPLLGLVAIIASGSPAGQWHSASAPETHDPARCLACRHPNTHPSPKLRVGRSLYLTSLRGTGSLYRWLSPTEAEQIRGVGWTVIPARPEDAGLEPLATSHP